MKVQTKVDGILFQVDRQSHIQPDHQKCRVCQEKPCLTMCPTEMYSLAADGRDIIFSHEGCVECGTCYVICPYLSWEHPRGGYGVVFGEV